MWLVLFLLLDLSLTTRQIGPGRVVEHHLGAWVLLSLVEVSKIVSALSGGLALVSYRDIVLVLERHLLTLVPESMQLSLSFPLIQVYVLIDNDFTNRGCLRLLGRLLYLLVSQVWPILVGSGLSLPPLLA